MSSKKVLVQALVVVALFLVASSTTFAADFCKADTNGDCKVNLSDLVIMKSEFLKPDCEACSPSYPAPVPRTGQLDSYGVANSDGDLQAGVARPNPRFTNIGDGTITDNLTSLIWLKNAECFGPRTWSQALSDCNGLTSGSCGLTDDSNPGDWRLPNLFELESLRDMQYFEPCLSNTVGTGKWSEGDPFNNVQLGDYWSSTTYATNISNAWYLYTPRGFVSGNSKANVCFVWPVRGGARAAPVEPTTSSSSSSTTTTTSCRGVGEDCNSSSQCCSGCCCRCEDPLVDFGKCLATEDDCYLYGKEPWCIVVDCMLE